MKYKDTIAFYNARRNNSKASIERRYPNCPTLTIADDELTTAIGQWLGELPLTSNEISKKKKDNDSYLTPSYLLRKKMVTEKDLFLITKRFANILRMIGISEDNICFLDNFKRPELKELSFDCYLYDTEEVIKIKLNFMTWLNCPELIVERNGITTEYEHWYCKHNEPDRLGLQAVKKELGNERNVFYYTGHEEFHGELVDKENTFTIDIRYPDTYESTDIENPYVNYSMLEEVLKQINFPVDYKELSAKIEQCLKMNVRKYDITFKSVINGEEVTYNYPDRVMIEQDDKELAIRIGDWLEASRCYVLAQESTIEARKNVISNKGIQDISRHFTEILKLAGLNVNSMCLLNNFDKDNLSFDCVLDAENIAHISLIMGTEDNFEYKISIQVNDTIKMFTYHKGYDNEDEIVPDSLFLTSMQKTTDWDRTFKREYDMCCYIAEISEDNDKLEVEIYYPGSLDNTYPDNPFIDEVQMDIIVSKTDLPIDVIRLYYDICKCFKMNASNYSINIRGTKNENEKEIVNGALRCRGNVVYELTITKRWRTITVKSNGAWSFDSLDWKVSQNTDKKISYTLNDTVSDENKIDNCPTLAEVYKEAKEEAEQVRRLAKSLVQPK